MPLVIASPPPSAPAIAVTPSASPAESATPQGFGGLVDIAADAQAAQFAPTAQPLLVAVVRAPSPASSAPALPAGPPSQEIISADASEPDTKPAPNPPADTAADEAEDTTLSAIANSLMADPLIVTTALADVAMEAMPAAPTATAKAKSPIVLARAEPDRKGDAEAPSSPLSASAPILPNVQPSADAGLVLSIVIAPAATATTPMQSPVTDDTLAGPAGSNAGDTLAAGGSSAMPLATHSTVQAGVSPEGSPAPPRQDSLPNTLFTQALNQPAAHTPMLSSTAYVPEAPTARATIVRAQVGQIGKDMGAVIARQIVDGREQVTVRLNPPEMGRIDVRLSFDHGGGLRAVMATESPAAMDMLRRDMGDLNRALADAGVRTDAQSFRFDNRHSGGGFAQSDHPRQNPHGQPSAPSRAGWRDASADESAAPLYRPLRASGGIDMIA